MKKINIAIDGFSSCGKSTLAKALAKELQYTFIDSGSMYRAITLYFIQHKVNIKEEQQVINALCNISIYIETNALGESNLIYLNGVDVSQAIRELAVANQVSSVAAIGVVRKFAVLQQQKLGEKGGVIMDGRDIGTVVFPDAALKIFMTASETVRIERRYKEMLATNPNVELEEVKANIQKRDYIDTNRAIDPLTKATDARLLDNSNLSPEEQLELVKSWVAELLIND